MALMVANELNEEKLQVTMSSIMITLPLSVLTMIHVNEDLIVRRLRLNIRSVACP